ncbi:MAG: hypothetical protein IKF38_06605 [Clostridia bacterium]|nr:hypothetical protein [Clostridia bacterium]
MEKKKEKFFEKIVKKNYNNQLELVLENKSFDENTKSILLSMMYKLESAYSDYETVKSNVMPKDNFLQMIIDVINKDVESIKIVKMRSKGAEVLEGKKFKVDKANKEFICYPVERQILYCISKISKNDIILKDKYYVVDEAFSNLLLIGNNINTVEAIRDFNGFSWDIVTKDIESLEYNLIYQNLRILIGAKFLNKWIYNKEIMLDYYDLFKSKLEEIYGKQMQKKLIEHLEKIAILLELKYNPEMTQKFQVDKSEIADKLSKIQNKEEYIMQLTKDKKELNKQIKNIDKTINDKTLLQREYFYRNEMLPLEKKIFSMRILAQMLKEERNQLEQKRKAINEMLNPQQFVKVKKQLEEKYKILNYMEVQDLETRIIEEIIIIQEIFLECYKIRIDNAKNKKEIINLITELRYYLSIPVSKTKKISQVSKLKNTLEETIKMLINKGIKSKILINILNDSEINYLVLKEIFNTKIINLQGININFKKEEGNLILQIFDENVFDKQVTLGNLASFDLKDFSIKLNKNVKIFTSY